MTVAPIPVLALPFLVLFHIHTISLVPFGQITAVRVVFTVIPVVVVPVVSIIDSDLNAGALRFWGGRDGHRCNKGNS
jgi:hypothetical protein